MSDVLGGIGTQIQQNPTLASTLMGGALGAGVGGIGTALGNRDKEEGQRRGVLGSMLTGGLAGAALGGGLGLATRGGFGSPGATPGAAAANTFVDPDTGQRRVLDPAAVQAHPELAQRARELTEAQPATSTARNVAGTALNWMSRFFPGGGAIANAAGATDMFGLTDQVPVSAHTLPFLATADWWLRNHGLHAGNWHLGRIDPRLSTNPDQLRRGMHAALALGDRSSYSAEQQELMRQLLTNPSVTAVPHGPPGGPAVGGGPVGIPEIARAGSLQGNVPIARTTEVPQAPQTQVQRSIERTTQPSRQPGGGMEESTRRGAREVNVNQPPIQQTTYVPTTLNQESVRDLLESGTHELGAGAKSVGSKITGPAGVWRTLRGRDIELGPGQLRFGGLLPRLALLAGAPTAEYAFNQWRGANNRKRELRELMHQVSRPAEGGQ